MKVLILSQKISDLHMDILTNALPKKTEVTLITGSKLERHAYIASPAHDPDSLISRLKCWYGYYSFVMKWARRHRNERFDFIFATSNPPINGYLGVKLKKIFNTKFFYMNWDLYPQVIETSMHGFVPACFSACWRFVNNRIYPKINQMVTIGSVMAETLNAELKKKIPVDIIPMFAEANRLKPVPKEENKFCQENDLTDKFVVLYSGKMGLGHNLELLLEASKLTAENKDIVYLFIGHGQKYAYIENWIKENKAENVRIMPLQSEEMFPYSMASGDIGFISQEQNAAKCFMPAKTYDMMACGMGIIAFSEGTDDLSKLVKQEKIGVVVTQDNPQIVADIILDWYQNRDTLKAYAENARRSAVEKFDVAPVTEKYRELFNKA